jgi:hypothetical protein
MIMLGSLVCFIIFTMALNFVSYPAVGCLAHNGSHYVLEAPDETINDRPEYEDRNGGRERSRSKGDDDEEEEAEPVDVREERSVKIPSSWSDPYGEDKRVVLRKKRSGRAKRSSIQVV